MLCIYACHSESRRGDKAMNTAGKTVSEIAREIGISRQALYKRIKAEPLSSDLQPFTSRVDGILYISADGEELIISVCSSSSRVQERVNRADNVDSKLDSQVDSQPDSKVDSGQESLISQMSAEIDFLKKQIDVKDTQLSEKDKQIEQLSESLRASQMLQAGLVQQVQYLSSPDKQTEPEPEVKPRWNIFKRWKK